LPVPFVVYEEGVATRSREAQEWNASVRRRLESFSKTSEFFVRLGTVLIAVLVVEGADPDRGWFFVTVLSSAYMLSRGPAKSGHARATSRGSPSGFRIGLG